MSDSASSAGGASPRGAASGHVGATTAAWLILLVAAALLPVASTASWLRAPYDATARDVELGIWLLKGSVVALGLVALAVRRVARRDDAGAQPPGPPDVTTSAWPLVAIAMLALGLRLYRLDTELWLDEIEMVTRYVPLDWRQLVSTYDSQNHHPLYTLLAHGAWLLAGGADWSVRLPAVLFGVASLWATQRFALRFVAAAEANLTALVLAVSYHHVWFSQNARGYTAILLFTVLATGSFLDLLKPGDRMARRAWVYAILMALATYTHLTAALVAVGHALALPLSVDLRTRDGRARALWPATALVLGGLLTICLYAPMLPQVIGLVTQPTLQGVAIEWTSPRWMLTEGLRALSGGIPGGLPALLLALAVLAVGAGSLWRASRPATLVMFLPVAATGVILLLTGHNLWPRFFFFASSFIVLAAIRGGYAIAARLVPWRPRRVALAGASGVALLSLATVPRAWQPKQQFAAALAYVDRERGPGDTAVALDVVWNVFMLRGWAPDWHLVREPALLAELERRASRTWIVYTLPTRLRALMPDLWAQVAPPRYEEVRVFPATVGGGEIHVLRRQQPPGND